MKQLLRSLTVLIALFPLFGGCAGTQQSSRTREGRYLFQPFLEGRYQLSITHLSQVRSRWSERDPIQATGEVRISKTGAIEGELLLDGATRTRLTGELQDGTTITLLTDRAGDELPPWLSLTYDWTFFRSAAYGEEPYDTIYFTPKGKTYFDGFFTGTPYLVIFKPIEIVPPE